MTKLYAAAAAVAILASIIAPRIVSANDSTGIFCVYLDGQLAALATLKRK